MKNYKNNRYRKMGSDNEKIQKQNYNESKNNSQILTELGLSEETLEVYLKKLYSKMNVTNRLQVIIYCYNNNLIPHLLN